MNGCFIEKLRISWKNVCCLLKVVRCMNLFVLIWLVMNNGWIKIVWFGKFVCLYCKCWWRYCCSKNGMCLMINWCWCLIVLIVVLMNWWYWRLRVVRFVGLLSIFIKRKKWIIFFLFVWFRFILWICWIMWIIKLVFFSSFVMYGYGVRWRIVILLCWWFVLLLMLFDLGIIKWWKFVILNWINWILFSLICCVWKFCKKLMMWLVMLLFSY